LYLLHGLFGSYDNWTTLTGLDSYIDEYLVIVVMPDGGDHWYTDAVSGDRHESYLIRELIPEIDRNCRTRTDRAGRIVAGNSMGGYGALKFALKHSDSFALAGSFSGAFNAPKFADPVSEVNGDDLAPSIAKVFGGMDDSSRSSNYIDRILDQMTNSQIAQLPYLYLDCGLQDQFISVNREIADLLSKLGARCEYHDVEASHDWQYWDSRIRSFLEVAARKSEVKRIK
jgi:S-formylglutathione hydrolase FrmB